MEEENSKLGFQDEIDDLTSDEEAKIREILEDVEYLYVISYRSLNEVFKDSFPESNAFKEMVLVMNQNLIEYRFLTQAGLL